MILQNPGPINSSTLAANVCTAFGYTDTPGKMGPGSITFIGNAITPTACYWDNKASRNWNNPNNENYQGLTGSYFCPCV